MGKHYLTIDTETATLPFVSLFNDESGAKQKISIAKPLVYDIGWVITNSKGETIKSENYLVQETFFVPQIFNTAYYKKKRPIYMSLYANGAIKAACWNDIINILLADLRRVDMVVAYNATFDLKKAIPFTDKYISHLYSDDYTDWERKQYNICKKIAKGKKPGKNPEFLKPYFELREECFPIADLWSVACDTLINQNQYKDFCLQNSLLTASAKYFKTSAETTYQFLSQQHDFTEEHTALSDAQFEAELLTKALEYGEIEPNVQSFPFRKLGTATKYVQTEKPEYIDVVLNALAEYIDKNDGEVQADTNKYWKGVINTFENTKKAKECYLRGERYCEPRRKDESSLEYLHRALEIMIDNKRK